MATSFTVQWSLVYRDRQVVKASPTTTLRTILEEVCNKQNFDINTCSLQHKKRKLDLSLTVRFANLTPNATLDLIRSEPTSTSASAQASQVTVALQTSNGQRRVHPFPSETFLWEILEHFSATALPEDEKAKPVVNFMNNEYIGEEQLRKLALRDIGLISGNGVLRLRFRTEDGREVPVQPISGPTEEAEIEDSQEKPVREAQPPQRLGSRSENQMDSTSTSSSSSNVLEGAFTPLPVERNVMVIKPFSTFRDLTQVEVPDSFYEMDESIGRVLLSSYAKRINELNDAPLMTQEMRERNEEKRIQRFEKAIIRIRFPDQMLLQGHFNPLESVGALYDFVASHLADLDRNFYLFITPPRQVLSDRTATLAAVGCVPTAMVNFAYESNDNTPANYLRSELIEQALDPVAPEEFVVPSAESAGSAASAKNTHSGKSSSGKTPKWLKLGK